MVIEFVEDVEKAIRTEGIGTPTTRSEKILVIRAAEQDPNIQVQTGENEILFQVTQIPNSSDFTGVDPSGQTFVRNVTDVQRFGRFIPFEPTPIVQPTTLTGAPTGPLAGGFTGAAGFTGIAAPPTQEEIERILPLVSREPVVTAIPSPPITPSLTRDLGQRVVSTLTPEEITQLQLSQITEQPIPLQQTERPVPLFAGAGGNVVPRSSQARIITEIERQERFAAAGLQPPPLPTPTPGVRADPADDAKDLNLVDDTVDIVREGPGEVPGSVGGLVDSIQNEIPNVVELQTDTRGIGIIELDVNGAQDIGIQDSIITPDQKTGVLTSQEQFIEA